MIKKYTVWLCVSCDGLLSPVLFCPTFTLCKLEIKRWTSANAEVTLFVVPLGSAGGAAKNLWL